MSLTGTESAVNDRTSRNLPQGGFGMAVTNTKSITIKLDDNLCSVVQDFAERNEMDVSKVSRLALKKFLGVNPPVNVKKLEKGCDLIGRFYCRITGNICIVYPSSLSGLKFFFCKFCPTSW